jgi:hypothetical protein
MASSVPPNFPPQSQPPFPPPQQLPPGKKPNILIWILGGIVVLGLGVTMMCGIGGYFLLHKAKQSGLDSALLSKNPVYAAAKMAATLNKDVDVLSTDDGTGTLKVRDKNTGKTTTMRFDPEQKRMVVTDEDGKESTISITGEGDKTALNIQSADGTAKFSAGGADAQLPAWVPVYPGSAAKGTFSSEANGSKQQVFSITTSDAPDKVIGYYQNQLKSTGFDVKQVVTTPTGGMVIGQNGNRTLSVTVATSGNETTASLVAVEKE